MATPFTNPVSPLASGLVAPYGSPGLKQSLGFIALTVYGVGNMLGAGIYGLVGKVAGEMGNAVWLAFVASMVAAGLTGLTYASLGSRYPRAAGAAYVTHRAFNSSFISYVIGLAVMVSGLVSFATVSQVFAGYFRDTILDMPTVAIVIVFIAILAGVNLWGLRESAWLNAACTCIEAGGLVLVVLVGMKAWGSVDYLDAATAKNPAGNLSAGLVLSGAVLTFFSFMGFEDMLNVSEEVKNPRRTFPLALVTALAIATLIYMAVSVTAVSVVRHEQLAASNKPLVDVMAAAAPWFPPALFSVMAMFAVTNTALLNYIMGSRLAYGMARQGLLPRWLGSLHPTRRTPHVSIAVLAVVVLILALSGDVATLARATSLLLLFCFCVVNAAFVVLKLRKNEPRGGFEIPVFVPLAGIVVCAALIANGAPKPLLIAGGLLVGIIVLYAVLRPQAIPAGCCLGCRYDLRGQPRPSSTGLVVCPECGMEQPMPASTLEAI